MVKQKGGTLGLSELIVPAGLFYVQKKYKENYSNFVIENSNTYENSTVSDKLFDSFLDSVNANKSVITKNKKTRKNRNKKSKRTRKNIKM